MASPLATALTGAYGAGTPPTPYHANVAPTDIEKAYSDYNNAQMQAYAAQVAQQNAMWGGLASLGSAGLMAATGGLGGAGLGLGGLLAGKLMGGGSPSGYGR